MKIYFSVVFTFRRTIFISFLIFIRLFCVWTHFLARTDKTSGDRSVSPCLFSLFSPLWTWMKPQNYFIAKFTLWTFIFVTRMLRGFRTFFFSSITVLLLEISFHTGWRQEFSITFSSLFIFFITYYFILL